MYIEGKVKVVSQKEHNFGVLLECSDQWYNGVDLCPFNKGDYVNFEFENNRGQGNWITKHSANKLCIGIKEKASVPLEQLTTQEHIWRSQCLNIAAVFVKEGNFISGEDAAKQVIMMAKVLMKEVEKEKYFE